ncbi:MAG: hypothetical protein HQL56_18530 [Magnetococcales bacterium]|nr:hypothetical protein [Magnetococcales bacterium]
MPIMAIGGVLGVNLTVTEPGSGTNGDQGNDFPLGTTVAGTDGTRWMFVHAAGAITQYQVVGIDENFEASPLTKAMADDGWFIGFAQIAFADNDFGWVAIEGSNIKGKCLANCALDVSLYTSATAGSLDDASTSQTKIDGVVAVSAVGSTAAAVTLIATGPRASTF